jgi:hypothetical protein
MWVTEAADAACGGNPWARTFVDAFRYVDQLGRLARRGLGAVFHNTLAASEYGLLEQDTFAPRPSYWAALLWRRLRARSCSTRVRRGRGCTSTRTACAGELEV